MRWVGVVTDRSFRTCKQNEVQEAIPYILPITNPKGYECPPLPSDAHGLDMLLFCYL